MESAVSLPAGRDTVFDNASANATPEVLGWTMGRPVVMVAMTWVLPLASTPDTGTGLPLDVAPSAARPCIWIGVPLVIPWTVTVPAAGVPAVPDPTTVALRLAAVGCTTVQGSAQPPLDVDVLGR